MEREQARRDAREIVSHVHETCKTHGTAPAALPAPSRAALLQLERLARGEVAVAPARRVLQLQNVVSTFTDLADRAWRARDVLVEGAAATRRQADVARDASDAIRDACRSEGGEPADLSERSRRAWCWIDWFAQPDAVAAYTSALRILAPQVPREARVHLAHASVLYRANRRTGQFTAHVGFVSAPDVVRAHLASVFAGTATDADVHAIRAAADSERFSTFVRSLDARAQPRAESAHGAAKDLGQSFERVNRRYFGGKAFRPVLEWTDGETVQRFGSHSGITDRIRISRTLDRPDVPDFVVDFVVYHELLHRQHGIAHEAGRRVIHSPTFRADEQRFERFAEAEAYLSRLARDERGRLGSHFEAGARERESPRSSPDL